MQFEISFNDIAVGNRVCGDRTEGTVTAVEGGTITVNWDHSECTDTITLEEFDEFGFTAYVKVF